jgi:hypothetical protein
VVTATLTRSCARSGNLGWQRVTLSALAACGRSFPASRGISATTGTTARSTPGRSIGTATGRPRNRRCSPGDGESADRARSAGPEVHGAARKGLRVGEKPDRDSPQASFAVCAVAVHAEAASDGVGLPVEVDDGACVPARPYVDGRAGRGILHGQDRVPMDVGRRTARRGRAAARVKPECGVARAGTTVSAVVTRPPKAGIPTANVKRLRMTN